jgi:hypothetical protein
LFEPRAVRISAGTWSGLLRSDPKHPSQRDAAIRLHRHQGGRRQHMGGIVGNHPKARQRQIAFRGEASGDLAFHIHRQGAGGCVQPDLVSAFSMMTSLPNNWP